MEIKKKLNKLKVAYKFVDNISKEERQQRLDKTFDTLFNETLKNKKNE